ncbi:hypothetical protein GCM10027200_49880 [Lentzea nigeriaca]
MSSANLDIPDAAGLAARRAAVAGRIIHSGRRHRLRLPRDWPYNRLIHTAYTALQT